MLVKESEHKKDDQEHLNFEVENSKGLNIFFATLIVLVYYLSTKKKKRKKKKEGSSILLMLLIFLFNVPVTL